MELAAAQDYVRIGEPIVIEFDLYADRPVAVDLGEDKLCTLSFDNMWLGGWQPAITDQGTRWCVARPERLPDENSIRLMQDEDKAFHWVLAPSRRVVLGPDKHRRYSIAARSAVETDGTVTLVFADDVWLSFCGSARVTVFVRQHYTYFASSGESSFQDYLQFDYIPDPDEPGIRITSDIEPVIVAPAERKPVADNLECAPPLD